MPRSLDPIGAQLPVSHNALERISPIPPRLDLPSLEEMIEQWGQAFEKYGIPAIKELTGIDLTGTAEFLDFVGAQLGLIDGAGLQAFIAFLGDFLGDLDFTDLPTPEEAWGQVVSTFIEPLNQLLSITTWQTFVDQIVGTGSGNPFTEAVARLLGFGSTASTANSNAGTALNQANDWITGFYNAFTGQLKSEVTVAEAKLQVAAIAETQSDHTTALTDLQAQLDREKFQGVSGIDSFDRVGTDLGGASFWKETWTGLSDGARLETNGSEAVPIDNASSNAVRAGRFRCTSAEFGSTLTDHQKITVSCGAKTPQGPIGASTQQNLRIYFRMNTSETRYGFVEIGGNNLAQWGYRNGGSEVMVGSPFGCALPTVGTRFIVEAGVGNHPEHYRLWRNNTVVGQPWDDSGGLVASGDGNRGWGWGVQFGTWMFATGDPQVSPPSVAAVSVSDNAPASVPGSSCRISRLSGSNVSAAGTGSAPTALPNGVFDSKDYSSNSIAVNLTTGEITVDKRGTYLVDARWQLSSGINNSNVMPPMFKNGTVYSKGLRLYQGTFGGGLGTDNQQLTVLVQCAPGDVLRLGRTNSASYNITADGTGSDTYFSVACLTP